MDSFDGVVNIKHDTDEPAGWAAQHWLALTLGVSTILIAFGFILMASWGWLMWPNGANTGDFRTDFVPALYSGIIAGIISSLLTGLFIGFVLQKVQKRTDLELARIQQKAEIQREEDRRIAEVQREEDRRIAEAQREARNRQLTMRVELYKALSDTRILDRIEQLDFRNLYENEPPGAKKFRELTGLPRIIFSNEDGIRWQGGRVVWDDIYAKGTIAKILNSPESVKDATEEWLARGHDFTRAAQELDTRLQDIGAQTSPYMSEHFTMDDDFVIRDLLQPYCVAKALALPDNELAVLWHLSKDDLLALHRALNDLNRIHPEMGEIADDYMANMGHYWMATINLGRAMKEAF